MRAPHPAGARGGPRSVGVAPAPGCAHARPPDRRSVGRGRRGSALHGHGASRGRYVGAAGGPSASCMRPPRARQPLRPTNGGGRRRNVDTVDARRPGRSARATKKDAAETGAVGSPTERGTAPRGRSAWHPISAGAARAPWWWPPGNPATSAAPRVCGRCAPPCHASWPAGCIWEWVPIRAVHPLLVARPTRARGARLAERRGSATGNDGWTVWVGPRGLTRRRSLDRGHGPTGVCQRGPPSRQERWAAPSWGKLCRSLLTRGVAAAASGPPCAFHQTWSATRPAT